MRNRTLAADHVRRAEARLKALDALYEARSWADVVRESQETVELALKGLLRAAGIDPAPRYTTSPTCWKPRGTGCPPNWPVTSTNSPPHRVAYAATAS